MEKQKIKAIVIKQQRVRGGINWSNKEKRNYESDIRNETDPD